MFPIRSCTLFKSQRNQKGPAKNKRNKPSIVKYNWNGINYPSEINDWKIFEKSSLAIALNVLYGKNEKICPACVSKQNSERKKKLFY